MLYGDTDRESYQGIKERLESYNRITALIFASVATVLIGGMLLLSFSQEGFSSSRNVYIFGIIFSVIQIVVALISKKVPALTYVSVYLAISVFLVYGIAIATLTRPEEQTVTFMVLLIFVPLIFVDRPIRMVGSLIFYIIAFIIMAYRTKTGSVLSVDITDAVIEWLYEHSSGTGTRKAGEELRNDVLNIIRKEKAPIVLDFKSVHMCSSSFIDEFVAKMMLEMGVVEFTNLVKLDNMNDEVSHLCERSIFMRVHKDWQNLLDNDN